MIRYTYIYFIFYFFVFVFSKNTKDTTPDPASLQLASWAKTHPERKVAVSSEGAPVDDLSNSLSAGPSGPLLIQDNTFFDQIQSVNRERIPPRVVHSKGPGAFGHLTINNDITMFSKAKVFRVGQKTPVAVRFSRVGGDVASSDTVRDTRGFSLKFFTNDGIWDLLCNNSPVFFVRDPLRFPSLIHSQMRNPVTHLTDPNAVWDFFTLVPESLFQAMIVNSDYGLPASFRHIHGFSINTFELVNSNGTVVYCRFHLSTNQGLKFLSNAEANQLAGTDPSYYIRDLYDAIATGNFPTWNMTVQIMTKQQLSSFPWNPFDVTKLWPTSEVPNIHIGTLVLNQNPNNYFIDVESIAFSPGNLVPGIQPSPDKLLQGRLFAYRDAQLYRLGSNSPLLHINTPVPVIHNYIRDGFARYGNNQGSAVNYYPNTFNGPVTSPRGRTIPYPVTGNVSRYNTLYDDNFSQATYFWDSLSATQQANLVTNLANGLTMTYPKLQARAVMLFSKISSSLGQSLNISLNGDRLLASGLASFSV